MSLHCFAEEINIRLHPSFPHCPSEVRYAVREQYAYTAEDVIARRLTLAGLDAKAAIKALPRVVRIMAEELYWSSGKMLNNLVTPESYLLCCL